MFNAITRKNLIIEEPPQDEQTKDLIAKNNECGEIIRQLMAQKAELMEKISQLTEVFDENKEMVTHIEQLQFENESLKQKIHQIENFNTGQSIEIHSNVDFISDTNNIAEKIVTDAKIEADTYISEANLLKQKTNIEIELMKRNASAEMTQIIELAKMARTMTTYLKQANDRVLENLIKEYNKTGLISC